MRAQARRLRRPLLIALVALVVGFAVDAGAGATRGFLDLTAESSLSLTEQTERIVRAIDEPTRISVFLPSQDPERAPAGALLLRYSRLNRKISFRVLDPRRAAGEVRRLGVDPTFAAGAIQQGDDVQLVTTLTEQDITGALARLARGRSATVCVATGHGEASVGDDGSGGLSEAAGLLRDNGYDIRELDLLTAAADVPPECDGLWLASPRSELGPAAETISRWLAAEGRLLVQLDPESTVDLGPVLSDHRLGFRRGIVLEGDPEAALPEDPTAPIVRSYSSASPIVRRLPPTFFPGLQAVEVGESDADAGLNVNRLAETSELSYLETEPLTSVFDPAVDTPGPITVVASSDRSALVGDRVKRSRVVAISDVDFATNAGLGQAANSTLVVRALDWLTLDDQLVVLSANIPKDRRLEMTAARLAYARFVSLALLPGLFLLAGATVWAVRRSR